MLRQCINGLLLLVIFTFLTGIVYPLGMTGLAQLAFPAQAAGSLLEHNGQVIGSALLGQNFSQPGYFHGRPSAAGADGYDANSSSGTNLGPTSAKLMDGIKDKIKDVRAENGLNNETAVPADLVTASGSGLDPDISIASAYLQAERVAKERNVSLQQIHTLIDRHKISPQFGLIGAMRINVLTLNLALDKLQ